MELPQMGQTYGKPSFNADAQYRSVSRSSVDISPSGSDNGRLPQGEEAQQAEIDLREHPQLSEKRSLLKICLVQFFGLLWLVPVLFLMVINLKGHVIGASAWCPGGQCYPDYFDRRSSVPQRLLAKYDHENHNLLGGLQLVAKALEVWFILITTWLVFIITMHLAGRRAGLPIAYLTRPSEFAELPGLFDPLLWTTLPRPFKNWHRPGADKARKRVWVFVLFTVGLCILCNLMGPATAVLVLPSLQWIETPRVEDSVFLGLNSDRPPTYDTSIFSLTDCTAADLEAQDYQCTYYPWGVCLDAWTDVFIASQDASNGLSQQEMVSFSFNSTFDSTQSGVISDLVTWAPNRQVLHHLSNDYYIVDDIARNVMPPNLPPPLYETYTEYNNSLQVFIQREGPTIGIISNLWLGYDNLSYWDTYIGEHQAIRCYENYNLSNTPMWRDAAHGLYTKCVKWGSAWDFDYNFGVFSIEGQYSESLSALGPSIFVETWNSDYAAFLPNGNLPAAFDSDCLIKWATVPAGTSCDWDALFVMDSSEPLYNRSAMTNTMHMSMFLEPVEGHPTAIDLMIDFAASQAFTNYSLDPSRLTNPLLLATMVDVPASSGPIAVDPTWTLASWSVGYNQTLSANRSATINLLRTFDVLWLTEWYESPQPLSAAWPLVDYTTFLPILQTMSLIDFNQTDSDPSDASLPASSPENPLLQRNARMNVWAYGMSSRTAWLGIVVCSSGCIIVVMHFFWGLVDRRRYRSPTQLLVAALEHTYTSEFDGKHDEKAIAKTPFRVEDAQHLGAGKVRFSVTS